MQNFIRPDRALIDAFRDAPTAVVSDNLDRLPGLLGLRPFHRRGHLLGVARTVRTRAGDNQFIHKMLDLVQPGDVVVVAGEGDVSRALVGEIMKTIAEKRGVAGFVIDGAIRDSAAFAASDFPCFARGVTHRGPYKDGRDIDLSKGAAQKLGIIHEGVADVTIEATKAQVEQAIDKPKDVPAVERQLEDARDASAAEGTPQPAPVPQLAPAP